MTNTGNGAQSLISLISQQATCPEIKGQHKLDLMSLKNNQKPKDTKLGGCVNSKAAG